MSPTAVKRKQGGQSKYTDELADMICQRIQSGESLNAICSAPDMPHEATVRTWVADDRSGFATKYAQARFIGLDALAERTLAIAADQKRDPNCRRVEVDAIKWFASKLRPDKYGDRSQVEMTGAGGQPLSVEISFVSPKSPIKDTPAARAPKQLKSGDAT